MPFGGFTRMRKLRTKEFRGWWEDSALGPSLRHMLSACPWKEREENKQSSVFKNNSNVNDILRAILKDMTG